ncbi:MBL fold metallo-hydrolase [Microbulbifer sp. CNSA002]|uniref:MBL fold metallo-hydrolase n=1 Tax=Microbulbifer sp. CNSA002 TaxID=3373604 RepID=UPI0039B49107
MLEIFKVGHCWHPEAVVLRSCTLRKMQFPAYCGLIRHPSKGLMLFDTGYAKRFLKRTSYFPELLYRMITPMELGCKENLILQLAEKGISPDEIKYIFVSHFHADHIAGLLDFPSAKFICSKIAFQEIMRLGRIRGLLKGYLKALIPTDFNKRCTFVEDLKPVKLDFALSPFVQGFDIFNDGSLMAISLPGHAAGQYGLFCVQDSNGAFLVGDAAWTKEAYERSVYPSPLTYLIMDSRKLYIETLQKLNLLYGSGSGIKIIPSHCARSVSEYRSMNDVG